MCRSAQLHNHFLCQIIISFENQCFHTDGCLHCYYSFAVINSDRCCLQVNYTLNTNILPIITQMRDEKYSPVLFQSVMILKQFVFIRRIFQYGNTVNG